ncbi:MAG: DUF6660 family protein [Flavisolibacter sp.]
MLSFYILFNGVVPCSVFDNCQEYSELRTSSDHKKNCNKCSPFSICSSWKIRRAILTHRAQHHVFK